MLFSQVLETVRPIEGAWAAEAPEGWSQGRTIFGGLQAALALRVMRDLVPETVPLRVLLTSFIAPVPPGALRIEARLLRSGRSVTHVEARIVHRDETACLVIGIFGQSRQSVIDIRPPRPQMPPPQTGELFPYIEGVTPFFSRQVTMRWIGGMTLFKGATEPKTRIYVGFRDEPYAGPGPLGEAQIVGYCDTTPSPGISLVSETTMASSLTWTVEMLTDDCGPAREGLWFVEREIDAGRDGYLNESATLWSPEGQPVALSRQSVAVFA